MDFLFFLDNFMPPVFYTQMCMSIVKHLKRLLSNRGKIENRIMYIENEIEHV